MEGGDVLGIAVILEFSQGEGKIPDWRDELNSREVGGNRFAGLFQKVRW